MRRNVESMDKSQYLEEIKSTAEHCYNIGYKRGYEAAIEDLKAKIFVNMHVDISAKMMNELLDELRSDEER